MINQIVDYFTDAERLPLDWIVFSVDVAIATGKVSTSLIQRKLSIGYGKAAKFLDVMEDMGIISEVNGYKPREVLITADEWKVKLETIRKK